ncbi:MAG: DUF4190 domain-containing protein [Gemmataceae bacterium]|nr:DUF4190 domain-containing protein [Gemmataceae bacterium]
MADDDDDEDDRPRRRRRPDPDDEDDYDDELRPRRRRRRPPEDDDAALGLLVPLNTSVLAILASYAALFSVLCFPAPVALLLGILALGQLKKNPKLRGHGRAWFAIVMGSIGSVLLAAGIVAALAGQVK